MIKIENWAMIFEGNPYLPPESQKSYIRGRVYGHPRFEDGTVVCSSNIEDMNLKEGHIKTASGSTYHLGLPEQAWMRWLEENNFTKYLEDLKNLDSHFPH